jgi:hypothetical protein
VPDIFSKAIDYSGKPYQVASAMLVGPPSAMAKPGSKNENFEPEPPWPPDKVKRSDETYGTMMAKLLSMAVPLKANADAYQRLLAVPDNPYAQAAAKAVKAKLDLALKGLETRSRTLEAVMQKFAAQGPPDSPSYSGRVGEASYLVNQMQHLNEQAMALKLASFGTGVPVYYLEPVKRGKAEDVATEGGFRLKVLDDRTAANLIERGMLYAAAVNRPEFFQHFDPKRRQELAGIVADVQRKYASGQAAVMISMFSALQKLLRQDPRTTGWELVQLDESGVPQLAGTSDLPELIIGWPPLDEGAKWADNQGKVGKRRATIRGLQVPGVPSARYPLGPSMNVPKRSKK